jgi:hypothetical protein
VGIWDVQLDFEAELFVCVQSCRYVCVHVMCVCVRVMCVCVRVMCVCM